jgi:hypothetical protein
MGLEQKSRPLANIVAGLAQCGNRQQEKLRSQQEYLMGRKSAYEMPEKPDLMVGRMVTFISVFTFPMTKDLKGTIATYTAHKRFHLL